MKIRPINLADDEELQEIANLVERNFREHPNYTDLSDYAREEYIRSNNVEGIRGTSSHPKNIMAIVIEGDQGIIGYSVVRRFDENIAESRRMHIHMEHNGKGIGKLIDEEAIAIARHLGCTQIRRIASGEADNYFATRGYSLDERVTNKKMQARGVDAHVNYAYREI